MEWLDSRPQYVRANTSEDANNESINLSLLSSKHNSDRPLISNNHEGQAIGRDSKNIRRWLRRYFTGWRTGALIAACGAISCFAINLAALVLIRSHGSLQTDDSSAEMSTNLYELFVGNCDKVHQMSLWCHLAINVLSTLLISGSSYCMQCLCAPNRKEVDAAHLKRKYVDIGVLSFRNLQNVARHRFVLWVLLAVTSVPLHLL